MASNDFKNKDIKKKVSIGLPVYNAEEFMRNRLDSVLNQTFTDFELIISDNASTDSTPSICEEYSKKDNRIRFIKQEKNMGAIWNYNFLLEQARGEYFLWVASDDILLPSFLEKNIEMLEKNQNMICSISRLKMYGPMTEYLKSNPEDSIITCFVKKIQRKFAYMDCYPTSGNYNKKMRKFLKQCRHNMAFYGIFRTEQLRRYNATYESFIGGDTAIIIKLLKYGDVHVIDEVLIHVYDGGISRSGLIGVATQLNKGTIGLIFPFYFFTKWCAKYLGTRIFLKNLDFFIEINIVGAISLSMSIIRLIKSFIGGKRHVD